MEKYPKKRAYVRGKLKKFLDEKGVTKLFIENCKVQEKRIYEDWITRDCKNLRESFSWTRSKEGFDFWKKLSDEFEELNDKT